MINQVINNYLSSSAVGVDPSFGSVVLLLGFEGADASTTVTDESLAARGTATMFGAAQIDTAQSKFGSSSLLLDGDEDWLEFADSADWSFGTGDFTVEAWVRFAAVANYQAWAAQWVPGTNDRSWLFDFSGSANNTLRFGYSENGVTELFLTGAWTPSANTWYHVAASRVGGTVYLFAGTSGTNTLIASGAIGGLFASAASLRIGTVSFSGNNVNDFNGWIDEYRITKGVGRYSAPFTVPTAAWPRS